MNTDATNNSSLGARIRAARDAAGLTQVELAAKIGSSPRSVSLWETTGRRPDFIFIGRIAVATKVGLDYFAESAST